MALSLGRSLKNGAASSAKGLWRFVMARPSLAKLNNALHHLSLMGLGVWNYEDESVSGERHLREAFARSWNGKAPWVVDVGAHEGRWTTAISAACPGAKVVAYEPSPRSFRRLKASLAGSKHLAVMAGLGSKKARLKLWDYSSGGSEHASIHAAVFSEVHQRKATAVSIEIRKLDDEVKRLKLGVIDLLKIDTEGNELAVLIGAERLIKAGRIRAIQLEFNAMNIASRVFFEDIRRTLPGWAFFRLLPSGFLPLPNGRPDKTEIFGFQNILAVPPGESAPR
jgi:FkbM family methyltransferase